MEREEGGNDEVCGEGNEKLGNEGNGFCTAWTEVQNDFVTETEIHRSSDSVAPILVPVLIGTQSHPILVAPHLGGTQSHPILVPVLICPLPISPAQYRICLLSIDCDPPAPPHRSFAAARHGDKCHTEGMRKRRRMFFGDQQSCWTELTSVLEEGNR
eukprot:3300643-Rhodomonas_salina.2